ncbi:MAG TPA: OmpH family outer membrane protein, partial [Stellaceae bacterium]|nr:OmpH family outer membrane protein [Stellaceae bacterium]
MAWGKIAAAFLLSAGAVSFFGAGTMSFFGAGTALAEVPPAPVIIVVDVAQLVSVSKAAKAVQSEIDQQTVGFSKEASAQEDALQKRRAELERQRGTLTRDDFENQARDVEQRYDALQKTVQAKRQLLQQVYSEAMTKVEGMALRIVADIAKERHANLVLAKQTTVFQADGFDITAEALKRLDEALPAMTV